MLSNKINFSEWEVGGITGQKTRDISMKVRYDKEVNVASIQLSFKKPDGAIEMITIGDTS